MIEQPYILIQRFTKELFQKEISNFTHDSMYGALFTIKKGVEILPALRSSCSYFNLHTSLGM